MTKFNKKNNHSRNLGIVAIICSLIIPIAGIISGIIGLCIYKSNPSRDRAINVAAIILGVIMTYLNMTLYS